MKKTNAIQLASKGFIGLSAFCILSVSLMAFSDPQSVMSLVGVKLENTDAFSSIRGVYGGVGIVVFIVLIQQSMRASRHGLSFLALFWGAYALSRIITFFAEGPLGAFGRQWLTIETVLFLVAVGLFWKERKRVIM